MNDRVKAFEGTRSGETGVVVGTGSSLLDGEGVYVEFDQTPGKIVIQFASSLEVINSENE